MTGGDSVRIRGIGYLRWLDHASADRVAAYDEAGIRHVRRGATLLIHLLDEDMARAIDDAMEPGLTAGNGSTRSASPRMPPPPLA